MGELIRKAREEAGLSQEALADAIYYRRPGLSDIENGKMEVKAFTLTLLAHTLHKPLSYFFPKPYTPELPPEKMSPEEQELLKQARRLDKDDVKKLIAQTRAIADLTDRQESEEQKNEMRMMKEQIKKARGSKK